MCLCCGNIQRLQSELWRRCVRHQTSTEKDDCGRNNLELGELTSNLAPVQITVKRFLGAGLSCVRN